MRCVRRHTHSLIHCCSCALYVLKSLSTNIIDHWISRARWLSQTQQLIIIVILFWCERFRKRTWCHIHTQTWLILMLIYLLCYNFFGCFSSLASSASSTQFAYFLLIGLFSSLFFEFVHLCVSKKTEKDHLCGDRSHTFFFA